MPLEKKNTFQQYLLGLLMLLPIKIINYNTCVKYSTPLDTDHQTSAKDNTAFSYDMQSSKAQQLNYQNWIQKSWDAV